MESIGKGRGGNSVEGYFPKKHLLKLLFIQDNDFKLHNSLYFYFVENTNCF
jgi:hypothetical protein